MSDGVRDWVVTYKGRPRAAVVVWAVIVDVPATATLEDVTAALEAWQRWPQWQARVRPGAVVAVRPRTARDADKLGDEWNVERLTWAALAPDSKRIGLEVNGRLYAAVSRAARAEGLSIAAWSTRALAAALGAPELAAVSGRRRAPAPAPLFVDEPLPLEGVTS